MAISWNDVLSILGAVILAGAGGEAFLKGVVGTAEGLHLPKLLVATTLAAFATSSPELTVSTLAALSGKPEIGLGDALGSNVVNIALVLGLSLLFGPIRANRRDLGRDYGLALAMPLLTLLLLADGVLARWQGALLLLVFAGWATLLVRAGLAHRARSAHEEGTGAGLMRPALLGVAGLAALIAAGRLFVSGASGIATVLGVNEYVIGATLVAIGTSLPEMVTVLLSRWRGHDDVGLGTLIGSNLFNGLAIVGLAATIHPIHAPLRETAVALVVGVLALLLVIPDRGHTMGRRRGIPLLALYCAFVLLTLTAADA
jgi:cation:H+ antiporter